MSADLRLKSFIDRVLRLKEEQDALAADIREVYAEAKAEGYDKTAMGEVVAYLRKIEKKGRDAVDERGAMFDLYLSTYEASGTPVATHAHAREGQSYSEAKARGETSAKLVSTVAAGMQTETGRKALVTALDIMIEREETGELTDNQESVQSSGTTVASAVSPASDESETDDVGATASSTNSEGREAAGLSRPTHSQASASRPADSAGEAVSSSPVSPAIISENEVPAFLRKPHALRPDCQHPDDCAGYGAVTCHSCKVAAREREPAEA